MAKVEQDAVALQIKNILNNTAEEKKPDSQDDSDGSSSEEETAKRSGDIRSRRHGNRFWKNQKTRFSSVIATKGLKLSFEYRQKLRSDLKHARELSKTVKDQRAQLKKERRERRKESLKRQEANARKNEIVQVIKNPAKLKRLKKKQLRNVEKRDTTAIV